MLDVACLPFVLMSFRHVIFNSTLMGSGPSGEKPKVQSVCAVAPPTVRNDYHVFKVGAFRIDLGVVSPYIPMLLWLLHLCSVSLRPTIVVFAFNFNRV